MGIVAELIVSKKSRSKAIGTKLMNNKDRENFKNAINKNNGKFYEQSSSTVNNIVNDIITAIIRYI